MAKMENQFFIFLLFIINYILKITIMKANVKMTKLTQVVCVIKNKTTNKVRTIKGIYSDVKEKSLLFDKKVFDIVFHIVENSNGNKQVYEMEIQIEKDSNMDFIMNLLKPFKTLCYDMKIKTKYIYFKYRNSYYNTCYMYELLLSETEPFIILI